MLLRAYEVDNTLASGLSGIAVNEVSWAALALFSAVALCCLSFVCVDLMYKRELRSSSGALASVGADYVGALMLRLPPDVMSSSDHVALARIYFHAFEHLRVRAARGLIVLFGRPHFIYDRGQRVDSKEELIPIPDAFWSDHRIVFSFAFGFCKVPLADEPVTMSVSGAAPGSGVGYYGLSIDKEDLADAVEVVAAEILSEGADKKSRGQSIGGRPVDGVARVYSLFAGAAGKEGAGLKKA